MHHKFLLNDGRTVMTLLNSFSHHAQSNSKSDDESYGGGLQVSLSTDESSGPMIEICLHFVATNIAIRQSMKGVDIDNEYGRLQVAGFTNCGFWKLET